MANFDLGKMMLGVRNFEGYKLEDEAIWALAEK